MTTDQLVSIGLPVRNGESTIEAVVQSVLAQDHGSFELIISDNASTDGTEDVCRRLARSDSRIVYNRHPQNIGLVNNFVWTRRHATGSYFRWIGDDDEIAPGYLSRCLEEFARDSRLVLVTAQFGYLGADGDMQTMRYKGTALRSDDPAVRFGEMLRLLMESYLLLDPVYGLLRRDAAAGIRYETGLRGDELFAARMALAGPWGHVPEILCYRHRATMRLTETAQLLGAPPWHTHVSNLMQCRQLLADLRAAELTPSERRRARAAVARLYVRRHWITAVHRSRKLVALARQRLVAGTE